MSSIDIAFSCDYALSRFLSPDTRTYVRVKHVKRRFAMKAKIQDTRRLGNVLIICNVLIRLRNIYVKIIGL